MNIEYISIILGEPYSTFSEIIGKYFRKFSNFKKKIILVGNKNLLRDQLNELNLKFKINKMICVSKSLNNLFWQVKLLKV